MSQKKTAGELPKLKAGVVAQVKTSQVYPDPDQPRTTFDAAALTALTDNIRERGIRQPLTVRVDIKGRIVIVDGERRWRAAKAAKLASVPVLRIDDYAKDPDSQLRIDQVSVNQLRESLKPMELAKILRGMIDAKKTPNEIAATLHKQGHSAIKPDQIATLAAMTNLPDWAQALANAGKLGYGGGQALLEVIEIKGLEKPLKKYVTEANRFGGEISTHSVKNSARHALEDLFIDLSATDDYSAKYSKKPLVYFDWKTRCKGCEHLKRFDGNGFCMSEPQFAIHNQEAIAAGLQPGGTKPTKPSKSKVKLELEQAELKTEQRERSLGEKARDYLHSYLARELAGKIALAPVLTSCLIVWAALKKPGSDGTHGPRGVYYGGELGASAAKSQAVHGLESLVCSDVDPVEAGAAAAQEILTDLPWRETHLLARYVFGNQVEAAWQLDGEFLTLFRKAELAHLARHHGCMTPDGVKHWEAMKTADLQAALLAQAACIKRPAILVELYEAEIAKPRKPYGETFDDEDFDEDGDPEGADDESTTDQEAA